jgi:adenylate cyclase
MNIYGSRFAPNGRPFSRHFNMAQEIERKFLLHSDLWRQEVKRSVRYTQGYFKGVEGFTLRVRCSEEGDAFVTIKGKAQGITRAEYEYPIPVGDARELLDNFCKKPFIEKVRHWITVENSVFEIDEFEGENLGLILVEIELQDENQSFPRPPWLGKEVTSDKRYYNAYLVDHPFIKWGHQL